MAGEDRAVIMRVLLRLACFCDSPIISESLATQAKSESELCEYFFGIFFFWQTARSLVIQYLFHRAA